MARYLIYGRKKVALENIYKIVAQPYFTSEQQKNLLNAVMSLEKKAIAICGNHDREAVGEPSLTSEMNPIAMAAVDWTKGVLSKENIKFLKHLSLRMKFSKEDFEIVHDTPSYPQGYEYVRKQVC